MKKIILFVVLFTSNFSQFTALQAQNPNIKRTRHWNFGEYAGLDFSSGNPIAIINSAMYNDGHGTASISDTAGNLLFYTDGKSVWNKNNLQMPNGSGLIAGAGSIQRVLIIPKPLSNTIYYIFHNWVSPDSTALYYSVVDMSLQSGFGNVTSKNNVVAFDLNSSLGTNEKLAATMHKNDTDVWVMAKQYSTNNFYAFRVTPAGVDTVPVISSAGIPDMYGNNSIKFSPSGKKLAIGFNLDGFELLDFDNAIGIVSNPIIFHGINTSTQNFGLEFSPDESKLYISEYNLATTAKRELHQVDLSSGDSVTMVNSFSLLNSVDSLQPGYIQQALDGKLYIANKFFPQLGVITNPNALGILCNYIDSGISLAGKNVGAGLPAFISNYFYMDTSTGITEQTKQNKLINIYPNPIINTATIEVCADVKDNKNIKAEIYDISGKRYSLDYSIISNNGNCIELSINRGSLPSGMYKLKIKIDNKIYTQSLITIK